MFFNSVEVFGGGDIVFMGFFFIGKGKIFGYDIIFVNGVNVSLFK